MARGSINHLALTVSDLVRSTKFYDKVLGFMLCASRSARSDSAIDEDTVACVGQPKRFNNASASEGRICGQRARSQRAGVEPYGVQRRRSSRCREAA